MLYAFEVLILVKENIDHILIFFEKIVFKGLLSTGPFVRILLKKTVKEVLARLRKHSDILINVVEITFHVSHKGSFRRRSIEEVPAS